MTPLPIRLSCIIDVVCEDLGVSYGEILSNSRLPRLVKARAYFAGAVRNLTSLSYPEIAMATRKPCWSTWQTANRTFENFDPRITGPWLVGISREVELRLPIYSLKRERRISA